MRCPVCLSTLVIKLRELTGQRTGNRFTLYGCFTCQSMMNPSGYIENDEGLRNDRDYLMAHLEHHRTAMRALVAGLVSHHPAAQSLLDIGAGVGALLAEARAAGLRVAGVEANRHAFQAAQEVGLVDAELVCQRFRAGLFADQFDIVTCNHVLEHLEEPRELVTAAISSVRPGGLLFLSVPFLPEPHSRALRYIWSPDAEGSPFFDNDAHVTHFSRLGMRAMAKALGLNGAKWVESSLAGYVFRVSESHQ